MEKEKPLIEREIQVAITALGCLDGDIYEKEPDCLETVKDLIRYLRRDTDSSSFKIRRQLTSLNVIEKDLIPILRCFPDDVNLFEATLRFVINLTQPLSEKQENKNDAEIPANPSAVISERLRLIADLKRTKRAFANVDLFVVVTEKLKSLISLDWEQRQEEDRLLIERLLIFVRNVLHIPPPDEDLMEKTSCSLTAHDHIVWSMHRSGLNDFLLQLSHDDGQREFHVFVLDIIALLLREHSPEELAATGLDRSLSDKRKEAQALAGFHAVESTKKLTQRRSCSGRGFTGSYTVYGMKGLNESNDMVTPKLVTKGEDLSLDKRKQRRKVPRNRAPAIETVADPIAFLSSRGPGGQTTLEIRSILKELCNKFIEDDGYNRFMRSVQYALERRNGMADGGSRYQFWWTMCYITAFVRHCGTKQGDCLRWKAVSETLSLHCLHEAQTQLEECLDIIKMEKKESRRCGIRAHVILKAYGEVLMILRAMENSKEEEAIDIALEMKKTLFYVMEYRELLLSLLKKYNPGIFTRSYLKDLIEIVHVYIKMLESHCLVYGDELKVQKKRKRRKRPDRNKVKQKKENQEEPKEPTGLDGLTEEEKLVKLEEDWRAVADELSNFLRTVESEPDLLPTDVVAFDCTAEHGFDEKIVAEIRIQNSLKSSDMPKAVALLRQARGIWRGESELFGDFQCCEPDDEALRMKNIFFKDLPNVPGENCVQKNGDEQAEQVNGLVSDLFADGRCSDDESESDKDGGYVTSEIQFSFNQYVQRFAHSDILTWYVTILSDYSSNSAQLNHYVIKMFHRIAFDLKLAPMLYQARLFRVFQKLGSSSGFSRAPGAEELMNFARYLLDGFFRKARKNKNVFIEILFRKDFKEAYEIDHGYGSYETRKPKKKETRNTARSKSPEEEPQPIFDDDIGDEFQQELSRKEKPKKKRKKTSIEEDIAESTGSDSPAINDEEGRVENDNHQQSSPKKKKHKKTRAPATSTQKEPAKKKKSGKRKRNGEEAMVVESEDIVHTDEQELATGTLDDDEQEFLDIAQTTTVSATDNFVFREDSPDGFPAARRKRTFAVSSDDEADE